MSDDSIIAVNSTILDPDGADASAASDLTSDVLEYDVTFTVTSEIEPSTAYYFSIEYTGGDSSNYIEAHYATVTSGGTAYTYPAGVWTADTTKTLIASVQPGIPPKAAFGAVDDRRLFVAGDPIILAGSGILIQTLRLIGHRQTAAVI